MERVYRMNRKIGVLAAACFLFLEGGCALGSSRASLGFWVPAEGSSRPLLSGEKTTRLLDQATEAGASDLFVQVFRGGRAYWASDIFERGDPAGRDPLGELLAQAVGRRIKVHAWVNVYNLGTNPSRRVFSMLPGTAFTRDNEGRSVIGYLGEEKESLPAELDTPGYWLDPSSPEATDFVLKAVRELTEKYPSLAGIHLDFVRYPYALPVKAAPNLKRGTEFGFGEAAIERFKAETGKEIPFRGTTGDAARVFGEWRREQVDAFVKKTRGILPEKMQLSAAAVAWADRAYLSSFQDWRRWLEEGTVNFVVTMSYSRDERFFRYLVTSAVAARPPREIGSPRVWAGIGAWDMAADPGAFHRQLEAASSLGTDGIVVFSYDEIDRTPELVATIRKWERREKPPRPDGTIPKEEGSLIDWLLRLIEEDQNEYQREIPPAPPLPSPDDSHVEAAPAPASSPAVPVP